MHEPAESEDAHLTPIARRLASAWPALSGHGGKLALYYVTRNPFDNVRSILNRWGLTTRVSSAAEQSFKFDAGTWSRAASLLCKNQVKADIVLLVCLVSLSC